MALGHGRTARWAAAASEHVAATAHLAFRTPSAVGGAGMSSLNTPRGSEVAGSVVRSRSATPVRVGGGSSSGSSVPTPGTSSAMSVASGSVSTAGLNYRDGRQVEVGRVVNRVLEDREGRERAHIERQGNAWKEHVGRFSDAALYAPVVSGFNYNANFDGLTALPSVWLGEPTAEALKVAITLGFGDWQAIRSPLVRADALAVSFRLKRNSDLQIFFRLNGVGFTLYELFNSSWESVADYLMSALYPKELVRRLKDAWKQEARRVTSLREKRVSPMILCPSCRKILRTQGQSMVVDGGGPG